MSPPIGLPQYEQSGDISPASSPASVCEKTSLDLTQRLERKLAKYNASQNIFKRWLFEIICWTTSAVCMGVIIGVCIHSRDQPLAKRPFALNIINVLSKVASAALILPISEAIGQLKWTWFSGSKSKEMIDFEIFDKASRGAWGSFLLLFRTKGRSLATLGAVLTLLLLATDTFFQQVVDLPERWVLQGSGQIPRVVRYEGDTAEIYEHGRSIGMEDMNLRRETFKFFYYNGTLPVAFGSGTRPEIPLSCPSSRCEWDAYDSLGICSACADISELLTYACLDTKLDWISSSTYNQSTQPIGTSCGYWLNATSDAPMLMSGFRVDHGSNISAEGEALTLRTLALTTPVTSIEPFSSVPYFDGSVNFKDLYFPTLDTFIVSAADGTASSVYRKVPPVAQECVVSWCVKTFQSSYAGGKYEENVTQVFMNKTGRQQPYPWEVYPREKSFSVFFNGNITVNPPWTDTSVNNYGVSNETFFRTQALFSDMFPSFITVANSTAPAWWRVKVYAWGRNQLRPVKLCPWLAPQNVTQYMERMATSLTDVIRSHSGSNEFVRGRAYTETTFIAVHLAWMSFPIALLTLSLIFLVATMIKTSKTVEGEMGMWKTSAMPALIYSLPDKTRKDFMMPNGWKTGLNRRSKKIKVRLSPKQGWRVSGQMPPSPVVPVRSKQRAPPGWI